MSRIVRRPRVSTLLCAVAMAAVLGPLGRLIATAGDLDPSFGIGGVATAPSSHNAAATAIAVQADGKILAAGYSDNVLARFLPDGSLDSGFGNGGLAPIGLGSDNYPFKVLLRPDGRIVVVAQNSASRAAIVQYNADGTLDSTFADSGIAVDNTTQNIWQNADAALQADGSLLVVGHGYFGLVEYYDLTVLRFTPGGAVDTTFGTGGVVHTDILGGEQAHAIAVQADGRFVVAGFSNSDPNEAYIPRQFAFVRYLPDGTLDTSFGTDGKVTVRPAYGQEVVSWLYDLLVLPDGRIVGAGFSSLTLDSPSLGAVVRLLGDGQLDTSFSEDGIALFDDFHFSGWVGAGNFGGIARIALQANGRMLAAGASNSLIGIRPDGTLDPDFHGDGRVSLPGPTFDLVVQDDDKPVIGSGLIGVGEPGLRVFRLVAENTPPALTPGSGISSQRGTSARMTIGTASDASDPLANLIIAPVAGTVPTGLTFNNFLINASTGVVSAVVSPSCTAETGLFNVQFSITDGGNVTTFATVPVEVVANTGPILSIADRTHVEGSFFPTTAVVTVTASGGVCEPITVQYATADGTATAPPDYTARSGSATIAIGQSFTTISIPVAGDSLPELDETFFVNLDAPVNATIADAQAAITILNDDPPYIQFGSANTVEVIETDDPLPTHVITLTLTRLTGLGSPSSVRVNLFGSARTDTDFVLLSPQFVHFAVGQTEAEVRIAIVGDLVEELLEAFSVEIRDPVNATIGTPSSVNVVIRDNDGPPDTTAPTLDAFTPGGPNEAGWHDSNVSVRVSAEDRNGSGVRSISYALSGAQAAALTEVPGDRVAIPIVTEGITVVTFFAEDVAGNVAASQSLAVRLDQTVPAVVVTSPQERAYALNEPVTVAYTCTDGGSGIEGCFGTSEPGAALDTSSIGAKTFVAVARDLAGNAKSTVVTYTVAAPPSDPDRPIIVGSIPVAPNAAGWHRADISVQLSASDGTGTGVRSITYSLSGAQTSAAIVVPAASASIPIAVEGITVVTFLAEDVAGNVADAQSLTIRLDKTAPGVVITSPQARDYTLDEAAAAAYACTDGGSGVATCTGTTEVGAAIDTASPGSKTFSATATDLAGNVATTTVAYSVPSPPSPRYWIRWLYDPLKKHKSGSTIPIKLQVKNGAVNVSSADLAVEAVTVIPIWTLGSRHAEDAGHADPEGLFRFANKAYLCNLPTTGLTSGLYVLVVRVAGDATLHPLPFLIR